MPAAPLDLDQLQTFIMIADTGSFTKAADEVHRTQSAVSMQMRRLEERIGDLTRTVDAVIAEARRPIREGVEARCDARAVVVGRLDFWSALAEEFPHTREQRCWVHKTANVLNYLPRKLQPTAKRMLHAIWMAENRQDAEAAFEAFVSTYGAKYPKAVACLVKDREALLAFYDFPAEHWIHIRTTNPIESTFATVRLRTDKTKGCGTRLATLAMVFKLAESASRHWKKLHKSELLADVVRGVRFVDGIKEIAA